jgi:hypothetical protein
MTEPCVPSHDDVAESVDPSDYKKFIKYAVTGDPLAFDVAVHVIPTLFPELAMVAVASYVGTLAAIIDTGVESTLTQITLTALTTY